METLIVLPAESGWRLDLFLTHHFPQYSRTLIRKHIDGGGVIIDGGTTHGKPSFRLIAGQSVRFTTPKIQHEMPEPENIPLDVLYEDDDLLIVNKPAGMVVHPSRGHWAGTLVSALSYRTAGQLSTVRGPSRPGIVHRLDRDTTGVILAAKNDIIHAQLAALFESRQIQKEYFAVVHGNIELDRDIIDAPIAHHPAVKEKMRVCHTGRDAKPAQTFYEVEQRFGRWTTLRCFPKTGRTHQIRVHLTYAGHPIVGDKLYGGAFIPDLFHRQALHARRLTFVHPATQKELSVEAPLPEDIHDLLNRIRGEK